MKKLHLIATFFFVYLFIFFLANTFIGSRPPMPFLPYGAIMLMVIGIAVISAISAHTVKTRQAAFLRVFTFCCVLFALYLLVQIYMYLSLGDNIYWIRTAVNLPLVFICWYSVVNLPKLRQILLNKPNLLDN
ncbi:hypothetical protein [Undibacterium sp. Ji49W]|uniref:hypothetical protein n=1 Tax=Undibacterium sp. Ji49W TaxID=3413040 RepID=UPI003BF1E1C3